ncbi:homolog to phage PhiH1 repressor protein [Natronomonas pharaonis DSM 2160]|uniref:Homolog to phage PhiH1 repressor protein n=1 Tax=Natronomonas pharaonis (strain ATCC 35678 / DSM 2160 / CIP 103997 / JCM 8858 / NBRC 14720 / NCIMB 2260 / Gabara) TaxID=348780 RepID=A0A1U7EW31_NATPD|nr:hypothetical protein [Natronomonas pharaonis]CAI49272.1 homolog to phage PhiH1 repressor protein [Natronomonas pharaonis DSM 2160]
MTIRRNAGWQDRLDERILELLDEEPWSVPGMMTVEIPLNVTEQQIRERCLRMADIGLVSVEPDNGWMVQLTTEGRLYLEGDLDAELYPHPRHPKRLKESL